MFVGRAIRAVYHEMQEHYFSFRILVWLKEKGITRRVNHLILHSNDTNFRNNPSSEMLESEKFFYDQKNVQRVNSIVSLFADDKSRDVYQACIDYRVKRQQIPSELFSEHDQYFVDDIFQLSDNEIFVDGGAYTGDTIQQFLDTAKKQKKKIEKIVAFEPDSTNYEKLSNYYGKRSNIILHKAGLSKTTGKLFFKSEGVNARIVNSEEEATCCIDVISIDDCLECSDVTYLKMDIEGAEWDALHGAQNTIKRNKPKLAICIYHSDDDMIRLIKYIHELVPEYRLYVRHHSRSNLETVLYAIV